MATSAASGRAAAEFAPPGPRATLTSDEVMTAGEVAELLHIPLSTVYCLARRGELPGSAAHGASSGLGSRNTCGREHSRRGHLVQDVFGDVSLSTCGAWSVSLPWAVELGRPSLWQRSGSWLAGLHQGMVEQLGGEGDRCRTPSGMKSERERSRLGVGDVDNRVRSGRTPPRPPTLPRPICDVSVRTIPRAATPRGTTAFAEWSGDPGEILLLRECRSSWHENPRP
jgi:hypothetical protein